MSTLRFYLAQQNPDLCGWAFSDLSGRYDPLAKSSFFPSPLKNNPSLQSANE
jgi:hypothetical protein